MKQNTHEPEISKAVWQKYQSNLFRHLMVIGRFAETTLVSALQEKGYSNLSMPFAHQLILIARDNKGIRITELAALQGISKQLCYQSLRPIEKAGHIYRTNDPSDGRAKLVKLTPSASKMIKEAVRELYGINTMFSQLIGADNFNRLNSHIAKIIPSYLYEGRNIPQDYRFSNTIIAASAGQVSRHFETQLINLNIAKGHHNLKPSFTQVLAYINLEGSKISTIADINSISNQAVARIATELEKFDYIKRTSVNLAQRSKRLLFTKYGLQLIADSVDTVNILEADIKQKLGTESFQDFSIILKELYEKISTDNQTLADYDPKSIRIAESSDEDYSQKNRLILSELLLYLASLCEKECGKETASKSSANKLTRSLQPNTKDASSPITFSQCASRTITNTAIEPEVVLGELKNRLGSNKTNSLLKLIEQLADELDDQD